MSTAFRKPLISIVLFGWVIINLCYNCSQAKLLFPTNLPSDRWVEFDSVGYTRPVCGLIHRLSRSAADGMPLGGVDTGCIDLETSGLWGYCTIFNSHVPRRGPLNVPYLGFSVNGETWILCDPSKTKTYHTYEPDRPPVDPYPPELNLAGVNTAGEIIYWGHYPVADLEYETDAPIDVAMRAWTPFLPGNTKVSMIPGAVFEVRLGGKNLITQTPVTLAFSFPGPSQNEAGTTQFQFQQINDTLFDGIEVTSPKASYTLGVIGNEPVRLGGELGTDGAAWANIANNLPGMQVGEAGTSVATDIVINPGETKIIRFFVTWNSPQWKGGGHPASPHGNVFTHMYDKYYPSSLETARLLSREHTSLLRRILGWQQVIYSGASLPVWLRESLVNNFHLITEVGLWAQSIPPIPSWINERDGLFGMIECPRGSPQIECIPCTFYGNISLVYFFPEIILSNLRGYKGYQYPNGATTWVWGGGSGNPYPTEFCNPTFANGWQMVLNGFCYAAMVDRYQKCWGDQTFTSEFYESIKQNTIFSMNQRPEYEIGDRIISMPTGNVGSEWFESPDDGWYGMVPHVGGLRLAQLQIVKGMAERVGDIAFAQQCNNWIAVGSNSLETKLWNNNNYLTYWEPETGKVSDLVFAFQLDGEWAADFHGVPGVFRSDRVSATLETIKNINVAATPYGAISFALSGGGTPPGGGYQYYGLTYAELLMLAMTYMYDGQVTFGLELARRLVSHVALNLGMSWDAPVHMNAASGQVTLGHDYYQNIMLWSLPAAVAGQALDGPIRKGGLADRVIQASKGDDWLFTSVSPNGTSINRFNWDADSNSISWQANLWSEYDGTEFTCADYGNIDGNGKPDILASNYNPGIGTNIGWFEYDLNTGTTNWRANLLTNYTGNRFGSVKFADVDSDGDLDVLTTTYNPGNTGAYLQWFEMNAGLTAVEWRANWFAEYWGQDYTGMAPGDVDGDAYLDVITTNVVSPPSSEGTFIQWFEMNTAGTALEWRTNLFVDWNINAEFTGLEVTDIDNDTQLDVVVTYYNSVSLEAKVQWYEMNTTGDMLEWRSNFFSEFQDDTYTDIGIDEIGYLHQEQILPVCIDPPVADLNSDCLVNIGDLAVLAAEWLDCGLGQQTGINDFDGDANPDYVTTVVAPSGSYLQWWEMSAGTSNISWQANLWGEYDGTEFTCADYGDIDGNGKPDILASNYNPGVRTDIGWFEYDSSTGATNWRANLVTDYSGARFGSVKFADVDSDGTLDVLATTFNPGNNGTYLQWFEMNAGLTAVEWRANWFAEYWGQDYTGMAPGDVDGDAYLDVITTNVVSPPSSEGTFIQWFEMNTAGTALEWRTNLFVDWNINAEFTDLEVTDIDGDARLDVITTAYNAANNGTYIQWFEMNAAGTGLDWQENIFVDYLGVKYTGTGTFVLEPEVSCINIPLADLDGNCWVDLNDFSILVNEWLNDGFK